MPAFPATIPFTPLLGSLRPDYEDNMLRGPADVSDGDRRVRFTAQTALYEFDVYWTDAERALFKTFWMTDLVRGSKSFTATDPVDGGSASFWFAARPKPVDFPSPGLARMAIAIKRLVS